ncbi:SMI1/KNR4 family protein [Winogradskyella helgolandensis]|jgi:hypothetical protein|uniref:SMI1/KNR4 family protein n=1 Tax=Winogradskyella helgolandensis TaxID=2697010 RepID=UPI0015BD4F6F|nr:SMI1/KNR4 family protein [Winogradskyella helgolandensis]
MQSYKKQIHRIKNKLSLAKKIDKDCRMFGAEGHKYFLSEPASENEIKLFEEKYGIILPTCFRTFLTEIGNGGINYQNSIIGNSAAGPNFGIYKLGINLINVIADTSTGYLQKDVFFTEKTTDEEWTNCYEKMDDNISDQEYDDVVANLYSGILTIGYCGCSNYQGIILNGEQKGRVIYTYEEIEYPPHYVEEKNFLDWYENWLDKVIEGETTF